VGEAVRRFKIGINDAAWSSNTARTQGLRLLAIAQLGSEGIDQVAFARIVVEKTIRSILPKTLRNLARLIPSHAEMLETAAKRCELEGDAAAAAESAESARSARSAAESAAESAWSAWSAARSAESAWSAAWSAESAWSAAWSAAESAAESARSAARSAESAESAARDEVLQSACQIGLEALIELKSPGCEYLYLAQGETP
jgi:hypothetical protein